MRTLARAHYKITQCLMTMIDGGACMTPTSTCDLCRWSMKTRYFISQMHRLMGLEFFPWVLAARCKVPGVQCPVPTTAVAWPVQQEDGGDVLEGAGGGGGSGGGGSGGGGSSSGGGGGSSSDAPSVLERSGESTTQAHAYGTFLRKVIKAIKGGVCHGMQS